MKNNSALISTAMLSALFDEKKLDNISLLIPFIIKIIYEDNSSNEDNIVNKMQDEYSFKNFPHAIVRIIINRLKKQGIIKQEHGKYIFLKDINNTVKEFDHRQEQSKNMIKTVINDMEEYLKKNTSLKLNYEECKNSFAIFLDRNGYMLYEDISNSTRLNKKIDTITYHIGRYIYNHIEKKDEIYNYLIEIIEGSLIANAIYVDIDSDNKTDLKKLNCYFDTPFMLRVLELKLPDENKAALELVNLLKGLNVKIKCFRHNYDEIENILEEYIRNYGKPQEKTLENLTLKNYSETDVRNLLLNLETLFLNLEIEIVDIPLYDQNKYKYVIDENKLKDNLIKVYKNKKTSARTIENDVKSVSAIMRIREGKEVRKLDECKAIFITTNKDIRIETNKLLNLDESFKISPVISDLDLTAIVWLKSLINNKNIPEMKLTENAMAAIKPSNTLRKRVNQTLVNLKTTKVNVTPETLYNMLCSNYYIENLMSSVNGNIKKINSNVLINTYEETLEQNKILTEKDIKLNKENENLVNQLIQKENNDKEYRKNIYKKYQKREDNIISLIKKIEKVIKIIVCILLFYISYKYTNKKTSNQFIVIITFLLGIYILLCNFIPLSFFKIFDYLFKKINESLFIKLNRYYTRKSEKEIESIFTIKK